jgi:hypothetical protein
MLYVTVAGFSYFVWVRGIDFQRPTEKRSTNQHETRRTSKQETTDLLG